MQTEIIYILYIIAFVIIAGILIGLLTILKPEWFVDIPKKEEKNRGKSKQ